MLLNKSDIIENIRAVAVITIFLWLSAGFPKAVGADGADLSGSLTGVVEGLGSDTGDVRFTLFDSKKNFLKRPIRTGVAKINDQQATWIFEGLPYGTYAVLAHHDVNANEKMERHWYGKPKEPTGASNNPPVRKGPPRFNDAKFQIDAPNLTLTITVQ